MNRLRIIMLLTISALSSTSTFADTTPCPQERALYVFNWGKDWGGSDENFADEELRDEDAVLLTNRTVFRYPAPPPSELPRPARNVRFETWRKDKLIWSVDGEIYCSDVVPMCNLKLKTAEGKNLEDETKDCADFPLPVEEIRKDKQVIYTVFGGLAAYSMACAKHVVRVHDKDRLNAFEYNREFFVLPPYVRFESCEG